MIGRVENDHALIGVTLVVDGGRRIEIEFVIDTGYSGQLALPSSAVAALGLPFKQKIEAELADGSAVDIPIHSCVVEWNGMTRRVRALATGRRPLLGTAFLSGFDLGVQFVVGGLVAIDLHR